MMDKIGQIRKFGVIGVHMGSVISENVGRCPHPRGALPLRTPPMVDAPYHRTQQWYPSLRYRIWIQIVCILDMWRRQMRYVVVDEIGCVHG